jgi:hypothetical protein
MALSPQARGPYLAGVFDNGLSVQVAKNGKNSWRVRVSKTSQNIALPVTLHEHTSAGTLFHTQRGTRWCLESQEEVRDFLQTIEPYVEIRKKELEILLKLCSLQDGDDWQSVVEEWKSFEPD